MRRRSFLGILPGALALAAPQTPESGREPPLPNRPKVPGTIALRARSRSTVPPGSVRVSERALRWEVAQTAIIICDMWDTHTCSLSAQRVAALAPRMNQVINAARSLGVMIIHAPSDTMPFYEGTPARRRMQLAAKASSPVPIAACPRDDAESKIFPIDDAAGGCGDPVVKKKGGPHSPESGDPAVAIVGVYGGSGPGRENVNYF